MAALVIMRERSASAVLALLLGIIITGIGIADLNSIQSAPGPIPPTERRWNRTIQPERCSGLPDFKLSRGSPGWLARIVARSALRTTKPRCLSGASEYRHGDSNPGFRRERAAS